VQSLSWPSLVALIVSAAVAGLSRGFSGFGSALIFVPMAATIIAPIHAAPLLLLVDGVLTLGLVPNAWRHANRREVATMAVGALVGTPLGVLTLTRVDPTALRWGLSLAVFACVVLLASGWRYRGKPVVVLTVAVGAASGFLSGVAQTGGPPVVAYWLGAAVAAQVVRANIVFFFALSTIISAVSFAAGGLLTPQIFGLALVVAPIYGLALFIGAHMFALASEATFRKICYALIAAAGLISLPALDGVLR
jgi:uncharacterized membrane protein YfcA